MVYPKNILLAGGGRWAKVYISNLMDILPSELTSTVYSPSNFDGMANWVKRNNYQNRINVIDNLELWRQGEASHSPVIITNAAKDHIELIEWAISKQLPVLCEKPISPYPEETAKILSKVYASNTFLATAHVFLFTRYLQNFRESIKDFSNIKTIEIFWVDAVAEQRYDEPKSYDPSVPIHVDCIPHIYSIIFYLMHCESPVCKRLRLLKGGSVLEIHLNLDSIPCKVTLMRNALERRRLIKIVSATDCYELDFTTEPGQISINQETQCAVEDWEYLKKPISQLLIAFFEGLTNHDFDQRLNINIARNAASLTSDIDIKYRIEMNNWLLENSKLPETDISMKYALIEILSRRRTNSPSLSGEVSQVWQALKEGSIKASDLVKRDL